MSSPPVHWFEGMFLRPHHFQAADRHWAARLTVASQWDVPFAYGVKKLAVDEAALRAYRFHVTALDARLRDGTEVRLADDGPLRELDLEGPLAAAEAVDVYLAVPARTDGPNVGKPADGPPVRYQVFAPARGVPDENSGDREAPVQFRRLNLDLLPTGADLAGYEVLQLARVVRAGQADGRPALDPLFVPPLLDASGWPGVRRDVLDPLYNAVAALVRDVGGTVREFGYSVTDADPQARVLFDQLRVLNEASAAFLGLQTPGLHPVAVHQELLRLAGQLSVYGPRRVFPDLSKDIYAKAHRADGFPPERPGDLEYDHDRLGPRLHRLKALIEYLLKMIVPDRKFGSRPFVGHRLTMQVGMDDAWLTDDWDLLVGVTSNLPPHQVVRLLTDGNTNMKIAAADRVEEVYARGLRGLDFRHEPAPPKVIVPKPADSHFSVTRTPGEWEAVQSHKTLAIRLNELLLAGSPPYLDGKPDMVLRGSDTTRALRFTLYVVPKK